MQASIKDIARRLNLSASTVSRALNGKYGVNPKTRVRVLELAGELGYVPNAGAKELVLRRSNLVGVLLPHIHGPAKAPFFETFPNLHHLLRRAGKDVIISWVDPAQYDKSMVHQWCKTRNLEGVLVYPGLPPDHPAWMDLWGLEIPVVAMSDLPARPAFSTVATDNVYGMKRAVEYLVQNGHRRIGYVGGMEELLLSELRLKGFMTGMADAGLIVQDEHVLHSDFTGPGGASAALTLLENSPNLTAIVYANDLMAIGGIAALHEIGARVPDDVSIIGCDGIEVGAYLIPALTTVAHDHEELGRKMAQRLLEMLAGGEGRTDRVRPTLIERASVTQTTSD